MDSRSPPRGIKRQRRVVCVRSQPQTYPTPQSINPSGENPRSGKTSALLQAIKQQGRYQLLQRESPPESTSVLKHFLPRAHLLLSTRVGRAPIVIIMAPFYRWGHDGWPGEARCAQAHTPSKRLSWGLSPPPSHRSPNANTRVPQQQPTAGAPGDTRPLARA